VRPTSRSARYSRIGTLIFDGALAALVAALSSACSVPQYDTLVGQGAIGAAGGGSSATGGRSSSAANGGSSAVGGTFGTGGTAAAGGQSSTAGGNFGAGGNGGSSAIAGSSAGGTVGTGGGDTGGNSTTGGQSSSTGGTLSTGGTAGAGGTTDSGGTVSTGGTVATGGSDTGGIAATGGQSSSTGGALATGGNAGTGGNVATGGSDTGGTVATGGAVATGGTAATGGSAGATGGTTSTGGSSSLCGGTFLLSDDFEDGNAIGWSAVEQTPSTPGTWAVTTDTGHAGSSTFDFQQTASTTGYHYQYPSGATCGPWGDQTVNAWVKPTSALGDDTCKVGVCARMASTDGTNTNLSGYCLFLRTDGSTVNGTLQVSKKVPSGSMSSLKTWTTNVPLFAVGTWYKVTIKVSGSAAPVTVTGLINDVQIGVWPDSTTPVIATGYPGLATRMSGTAPATANFDDVTVTSP
jgi:hypothetical protein